MAREYTLLMYILYFLVIFLLLFVLLLGAVRMGAQRWLKILWLNFQPSELAKLVVILFLAHYFSQRSLNSVWSGPNYFGITRGLIIPFFVVSIPILLILKQSNLAQLISS